MLQSSGDSRERIRRLLRPGSIAVVGASSDRSRLTGIIVPLLQDGGFKGRIYPVNPSRTEIAGLLCYPSLREIGEGVDHAIVIVRRELVPEVLEAAAEKGVAGASIFSSGFAEVGEEGEVEQSRLAAYADRVTFLGPNCLGFANLVDGILATASPVITRNRQPGDVALVSQSGGLAFGSIAYFAAELGVQFTYMVNTGNSAGVDMGQLTEFLFDDPETKLIWMVLEGESLAADVIAAVRRRGLVKPMVLLKLGRGQTGTRMARSHTGSLAGDYRLLRDAAEQVGIVCADGLDDSLNVLQLLRAGFDHETATGGLGAVSISGGNVTLFADAVDEGGLRFAELAPETLAELRSLLPAYITVHNPIDLTALGFEQPQVHRRVLELLLADPGTSCLVPILTSSEDYSPVVEFVCEVAAASEKQTAVVWNGGSYDERSPRLLKEARLPVMRSAAAFVQAMELLGRPNPALEPDPPLRVVRSRGSAQRTLRESESFRFLADNGVAVAPWRPASPENVIAAAAEVGYPVVVKTDTADTHISDRGEVFVGLRNEADVAKLQPRLARGAELMVVRQLEGLELFASTFEHPSFGLIMTIGSGGRLVELFNDVRFLVLPASRDRLAALLGATTAGRALRSGFRGSGGVEPALDWLEALAALALDRRGRVAQIEVNPLLVGPSGAAAVDAAVETIEPAP